MFPDFSGLIYLITVPACVVVALIVDIVIALIVGPTWWLLAPPAVAFWAGVKLGNVLNR